jgi:hypothetical protein
VKKAEGEERWAKTEAITRKGEHSHIPFLGGRAMVGELFVEPSRDHPKLKAKSHGRLSRELSENEKDQRANSDFRLKNNPSCFFESLRLCGKRRLLREK